MIDCKTNNLPLSPTINWIVKYSNGDKILDNVPYAKAIGSIMYAMAFSRPNLAYAINILSRFMMKPK